MPVLEATFALMCIANGGASFAPHRTGQPMVRNTIDTCCSGSICGTHRLTIRALAPPTHASTNIIILQG